MLFMMLLYLFLYVFMFLLMIYEHRLMHGERESVIEFVRNVNPENKSKRNFLIIVCVFSVIAPFFVCGVLVDSIVKFKKEEEK